MASPCKFCGKEIKWDKVDGKPTPFNPDGTPHRCQKTSTPTGIANIVGRVTEYEGSNVHLGSKIFYLIPENRKAAQENFPVGSITRLEYEKGTCKGMEKATGPDLEKFLKEEGEQRTLPAQVTAPAAAATRQEAHKETCTSPVETPARKKTPIEENRMPSREELLAMVYSYDTYWKAKTLMDIIAHEEIRQQVEVKNWQQAIELALGFHEGCEVDIDKVFLTSEKVHAFIKGKTGGA